MNNDDLGRFEHHDLDDLNHLHINYEELIDYIKARQPKDSAELTFAICHHLKINDRRLVNKIVEILIELDRSIREIELMWYAPAGLDRGIIEREIDYVTGDYVVSHGLINLTYRDMSFAITA
jgi:hypothetical protein